MGLGLRRRGARLLPLLLLVAAAGAAAGNEKGPHKLRFRRESGTFKVVQVADMHYADGRRTGCENVLPSQEAGCSDLNTTAFLYRVFRAEDPDLVVFTGDNIYGSDSTDAAKSMDAAIAPAIDMKLPWAAVIGNHDQEGTLSREGVMRHLVGMKNSLSSFNPGGIEIDGYGNYNLEVSGVERTSLDEKSVLNLYFLDSGDYSTVRSIKGYGWIKASQQVWFQQTSSRLQRKYMDENPKQKEPAPGLVFFHIPLPEFSSFTATNFTGVKQEGISSPSINSGFFATMVESGDVRAAFVGHDHINDFCGTLSGIQLCYAGGFGYHAYGKAGWSRRARVVSVQLEKTDSGEWGGVKSIKTWKRLDDPHLSTIDSEVLWNRGSNGRRRKNPDGS
ncbi:probable inactive purple acid phosphatase 29 isoform X2 [Phragmites australis]|uniref:probable inactive purple acid phosphatase 29 isoform X2 n=1 Tax=Phragmites australis TaxID=29695 RepID=UPI002D78CBC4|nr:probable inactive purple acid phosphatase 29 isoform X2 [Phragmites australis]